VHDDVVAQVLAGLGLDVEDGLDADLGDVDDLGGAHVDDQLALLLLLGGRAGGGTERRVVGVDLRGVVRLLDRDALDEPVAGAQLAQRAPRRLDLRRRAGGNAQDEVVGRRVDRVAAGDLRAVDELVAVVLDRDDARDAAAVLRAV
jgi:hypothetical protein